MIALHQLKLKLNSEQESLLNQWLWNLTGVYNWAIKKIELDAKDGIYYSPTEFQNILAGHSKRLEIPSHVIQGILCTVYESWKRYFKKMGGKPKFKGNRNKLNSIPFPDPIRRPIKNKISILGIQNIKFHKQFIPDGKIKCGRIVRRASGWYLCAFIDCERAKIERTNNGKIGIDPGFKHLLTLSNGDKIEHPREFEKSEKRIAQAQRGRNKRLTARLQERKANQVKDRNHKLSLKLVKENIFIAFSKDSHQKIAKNFGRSVNSSSHYQLRQMIKYKSSSCDTQFVEVDPKFSTMTCSVCKSKSGPTGLNELAVRNWKCCDCGSHHDRDINAAMNTFNSGLGLSLKNSSNGVN